MNTFGTLLNQMLPPFYWFRVYHSFTPTELVVQGIIQQSRPITPGSLIARVDGLDAEIEILEKDEYADRTFWYLPSDRRKGFRARIPLQSIAHVKDPWHLIEVLPADHESIDQLRKGRRTEFAIARGWETFELTPPKDAIERVSGPGATPYNYFNNGYTDFLRFSQIAKDHGKDLDESTTSILDWGCGCARLTRHLLSLPSGRSRVMGSDIDASNVGWSKAALGDHFTTNALMPPLGSIPLTKPVN